MLARSSALRRCERSSANEGGRHARPTRPTATISDLFPIAAVRMTRFDTAAGLFGKGRLADELCITVPTLNFNINRDRDASDPNIPDVAAARRSRGPPTPASCARRSCCSLPSVRPIARPSQRVPADRRDRRLSDRRGGATRAPPPTRLRAALPTSLNFSMQRGLRCRRAVWPCQDVRDGMRIGVRSRVPSPITAATYRMAKR